MASQGYLSTQGFAAVTGFASKTVFAGAGSCKWYLFSSANSDSLQLGSAFTGNLKVMINAPAETGLHPDIVAGRMGSFASDTWVQYEITASALTYIVDATFNERVAYAKDNVWFNVDMGTGGNIPDSGGDIIENMEPSSWQKGECVPAWAEASVHTEQFTEQYT